MIVPKPAEVPLSTPAPSTSTVGSLAVRPGIWKPGPKSDVLPGIVPQPAKLPGVTRWQVQYNAPSNFDGSSPSNRGCWSPDGQWFAVADVYQVSVYRLVDDDLQPYRTFAHPTGFRSLAFSPDSRQLAVIVPSRFESPIQLFDLATGKQVQVLHAAGNYNFQDLAWSPDGTRLLAIGVNTFTRMFLMPAGQEDTAFTQKGISASFGTWSPDSQKFVAFETDRKLHVRGLKGDEQVVLEGEPFDCKALAWSNDGQWIAAGGHGFVQIWHATGKVHHRIPGHLDGVVAISREACSLSWSPTRPELAVGSLGLVSVTDLTGEPKTMVIATGRQQGYRRVAHHPTRDLLVTVKGQFPSIAFHQDGQSREVIGPRIWSNAAYYSPDNGRIAFFTGDERTALQDLDGEIRYCIKHKGTHGSNRQGAWSPDGRYFASFGMAEQVLRIWDTQTQQPGPSIPSSPGRVIWSPDSRKLAIATATLTAWSVPEGNKLWSSPTSGAVPAWSAKGDRIVSGGGQLLDANDGKVVQDFSKVLPAISGGWPIFSWRPDGSRVLATGFYGTIASVSPSFQAVDWTFDSARLLYSTVPAYSPDGKYVAASNAILNADSGAVVKEYSTLNSVCWHSDNKRLLATQQGRILVRDTETLVDEFVIVPLPGEQVAVFDVAGNLVRGGVADFEEHLVYFVDRDDGTRDVLKPTEFHARFHTAR